jgi:hypothetical protein
MTPRTEFFLGSNGLVTFGTGSIDNSPTIPELLSSPPLIATP